MLRNNTDRCKQHKRSTPAESLLSSLTAFWKVRLCGAQIQNFTNGRESQRNQLHLNYANLIRNEDVFLQKKKADFLLYNDCI